MVGSERVSVFVRALATSDPVRGGLFFLGTYRQPYCSLFLSFRCPGTMAVYSLFPGSLTTTSAVLKI